MASGITDCMPMKSWEEIWILGKKAVPGIKLMSLIRIWESVLRTIKAPKEANILCLSWINIKLRETHLLISNLEGPFELLSDKQGASPLTRSTLFSFRGPSSRNYSVQCP